MEIKFTDSTTNPVDQILEYSEEIRRGYEMVEQTIREIARSFPLCFPCKDQMLKALRIELRSEEKEAHFSFPVMAGTENRHRELYRVSALLKSGGWWLSVTGSFYKQIKGKRGVGDEDAPAEVIELIRHVDKSASILTKP